MSIPTLHIYFLHYNAHRYENNSRDPLKLRPNWFNYELCLENVIKTTLTQRIEGSVRLTIWYDGDDDDLNNDPVIGHISNSNLATSVSIIKNKWASGKTTFLALRSYLQNNVIDIDEGDYIYFFENDYLHIDNWYQMFLEVIQSNIKFDYISLYDHSDNYNLPFHQNFIQKLRYTDNHIWKKVFSTCASVIVRYDTFKKDISILNMDDFTTFCYLNLLGRDLICPVPGLSTHAMLGYESPGVNWDAVAKRN